MKGRQTAFGFTLTELVVVIVIATVLSAFAISRINTTSFNTEGFANQAAAMIRYAQRIAISQRRTVFVVISGTEIKLCYTDSACGSPVRDPAGTTPPAPNEFKKTVPSDVTLVGSTFSYNALGKPSAGGTITISGGDISPRTITIAAETGYVQY